MNFPSYFLFESKYSSVLEAQKNFIDYDSFILNDLSEDSENDLKNETLKFENWSSLHETFSLMKRQFLEKFGFSYDDEKALYEYILKLDKQHFFALYDLEFIPTSSYLGQKDFFYSDFDSLNYYVKQLRYYNKMAFGISKDKGQSVSFDFFDFLNARFSIHRNNFFDSTLIYLKDYYRFLFGQSYDSFLSLENNYVSFFKQFLGIISKESFSSQDIKFLSTELDKFDFETKRVFLAGYIQLIERAFTTFQKGKLIFSYEQAVLESQLIDELESYLISFNKVFLSRFLELSEKVLKIFSNQLDCLKFSFKFKYGFVYSDTYSLANYSSDLVSSGMDPENFYQKRLSENCIMHLKQLYSKAFRVAYPYLPEDLSYSLTKKDEKLSNVVSLRTLINQISKLYNLKYNSNSFISFPKVYTSWPVNLIDLPLSDFSSFEDLLSAEIDVKLKVYKSLYGNWNSPSFSFVSREQKLAKDEIVSLVRAYLKIFKLNFSSFDTNNSNFLSYLDSKYLFLLEDNHFSFLKRLERTQCVLKDLKAIFAKRYNKTDHYGKQTTFSLAESEYIRSLERFLHFYRSLCNYKIPNLNKELYLNIDIESDRKFEFDPLVFHKKAKKFLNFSKIKPKTKFMKTFLSISDANFDLLDEVLLLRESQLASKMTYLEPFCDFFYQLLTEHELNSSSLASVSINSYDNFKKKELDSDRFLNNFIDDDVLFYTLLESSELKDNIKSSLGKTVDESRDLAFLTDVNNFGFANFDLEKNNLFRTGFDSFTRNDYDLFKHLVFAAQVGDEKKLRMLCRFYAETYPLDYVFKLKNYLLPFLSKSKEGTPEIPFSIAIPLISTTNRAARVPPLPIESISLFHAEKAWLMQVFIIFAALEDAIFDQFANFVEVNIKTLKIRLQDAFYRGASRDDYEIVLRNFYSEFDKSLVKFLRLEVEYFLKKYPLTLVPEKNLTFLFNSNIIAPRSRFEDYALVLSNLEKFATREVFKPAEYQNYFMSKLAEGVVKRYISLKSDYGYFSPDLIKKCSGAFDF